MIIHISYTAEEDGELRNQVEDLQEDFEDVLLNLLKDNPLPRIFSLRHEFSSEFHRLLHGPAGQQAKITLTLTDKHFPIFLKGKNLRLSEKSAESPAFLVLRTAKDQRVGNVNILVNDLPQTGFAPDERFGKLPSKGLDISLIPPGILGDYTLAIKAPGDLAPEPPATSGTPTIDSGKLKDIYLYLEYTIDKGGD